VSTLPDPATLFDKIANEPSGRRGLPRLSHPRSQKSGRPKDASTIALGKMAHDVLAKTPYAMTLRQLYYALVSVDAIPKTEAGYTKLKTVLKDLREDGTIPWDWIVDHVRSVFAARTWDGVAGLLTDSANLYRSDLMRQQDVAIQLWAESDSIGSVIAPVAERYTIPTFIGRGYASRGYLWSAAKDAVVAHEAGKTVVILHVGDFDPSGVDIFRDVEETLRLYALTAEWSRPPLLGVPGSVADVRRSVMGDARNRLREGWYRNERTAFRAELGGWTDWFEFERLALTPEQIEEYELPSRPPKTTDVRTAKFTGTGTVEVEAMPVEALLAVVEQAIRANIDSEALRIAEMAEESERSIAKRIAATPVEMLLTVAS
jgi:hypothetical protein